MVETLTITEAERSFAANEHRELAPGIDDIERVAGSIGWTSQALLNVSLRRVRNWLATVLVPHAAWENAVVYPEMDERAGTAWATRMMRFEHQQIGTAMSRLERDAERMKGAAMTHEDT